MVEVMKIMAPSFKRSCACTAALSARDPAAGHCQCMPLPETPETHGRVWASLFWGHHSFLLGSGVHKVLFVPSKSLFPQSCVKTCNLITLSSKVKYPGGSQSLHQIPRLGNMLRILELS